MNTVAEPVFDEFVFHFKDNIEFSPEVGENFRHHEAIIWAVFTNIDQSEKHLGTTWIMRLENGKMNFLKTVG